MTTKFKFRTPNSALRAQRAFTLIELLVVIAIIGLLAGLIIGGAGIAYVKSHRSRAETERAALITAIGQYKAHKGVYPPDNAINGINVNSASCSLFYELTGVVAANNVGNGNPGFIAVNGDRLDTNSVFSLFGMGGILNSSSDTNEPAENFLKSAGKNARTGSYVGGAPSGRFTLFGLPLQPGPPATLTPTGAQVMNPWHYVSSNPTNNPDEFDLWIDVTWGGKTNRISNWSKDPQVL